MTPPALDCHAHIAPDVTIPQLQQLGGAHVLAVTRTLDEAALVARRPPDDTVTWGLGAHPAVESSYQFDADRFARLLPSFALVGEVGLNGRGKKSGRADTHAKNRPRALRRPVGAHLGA